MPQPLPSAQFVCCHQGKGKGLDTCYSAAYMSQTRDQQRFYSLGSGSWLAWANGAAAQYPLPTLTDNRTHDAASRHTITPISYTRHSPRSRSYYSFPIPLTVGGWVAEQMFLSTCLPYWQIWSISRWIQYTSLCTNYFDTDFAISNPVLENSIPTVHLRSYCILYLQVQSRNWRNGSSWLSWLIGLHWSHVRTVFFCGYLYYVFHLIGIV